MIKQFIVLAGISLGASAQAATFNYDYQGQTLEGPTCEGFCDEAFTGSLWIDEALFPGSMIAGSQFDIAYNSFDGTEQGDTGTYSITSAAGSFVGSFMGTELPDFVTVGGDIDTAIFGVIADAGQFSWTFDEDSQIVSWESSGFYGGSNDFTISSRGDSVADDRKAGPGTWTLTSSNDVPAPVPLPAAGLLLVGALGALGLGRKLNGKT